MTILKISSKFRLGDKVIVTTGKDKSKIGDIIAINRETGKVKVKGVRMVSKITKDSVNTSERFLDVSNVLHVDANNKPSRVGFKVENGQKIRFFKSTKATLSVVTDFTKRAEAAKKKTDARDAEENKQAEAIEVLENAEKVEVITTTKSKKSSKAK